MSESDQNFKKEQQYLKFSLVLVVILMLWGLIFNELTESNIIALDAGAYVVSAIIGIVTIYVSQLSTRPKSTEHPLGYSGFIPVLNLIRSFMIVLICMKGISESIGAIVAGPEVSDHRILYIYAGVTLVLNFLGYIFTHIIAVRLNSALLKTDSIEWKIDTLYNVSILLAISVSYVLQFSSYSAYTNYVDPVFCIILSIYMCYSPILLFVENVKVLSLSKADLETHEYIVQAFHRHHPEINVFQPKFTVLQIAGTLWVDIELKTTTDRPITFSEFAVIKNTGELLLQKITSDYKLSFEFSQLEEL